jgi:hypothetical protein
MDYTYTHKHGEREGGGGREGERLFNILHDEVKINELLLKPRHLDI